MGGRGEGTWRPPLLLPAHRTGSKALAGKFPFSNSHLCLISSQNLKATESVSKNGVGGGVGGEILAVHDGNYF